MFSFQRPGHKATVAAPKGCGVGLAQPEKARPCSNQNPGEHIPNPAAPLPASVAHDRVIWTSITLGIPAPLAHGYSTQSL